MEPNNESQPGLLVLWVTQDREAALHMALMYAQNSRRRGWWETVHLLVWGPSADLLAQDREVQEEVAACAEAGVKVLACKACADRYHVSDKLAALGIEVVFAGQPLTRYLKDGWKVLTV